MGDGRHFDDIEARGCNGHPDSHGSETPLPRAVLQGRQAVDHGGQDEIAFSEATDIRMMALFFRQFTYLVGEIEGLTKILELETPLQMVGVDGPPSGIELVKQFFQAGTFQRRGARLAGNTVLRCKFALHRGWILSRADCRSGIGTAPIRFSRRNGTVRDFSISGSNTKAIERHAHLAERAEGRIHLLRYPLE